MDDAIARARHVIHNNDVESLKRLLAEYPGLLSWTGDSNGGGLLGLATGAYGDAFGSDRESWFTRKACAEVLIDAGAAVMPPVVNRLLDSRAVGLLQLFDRKGLLPRTLPFESALGDLERVRVALDQIGNDVFAVNEGFIVACRFTHEPVASLLLDRAIALNAELGRQIDGSVGRAAFIRSLIEKQSVDFGTAKTIGPWRTFVTGQLIAAIHEGDASAFVHWLQRELWLLGDEFVWLQKQLIETATLNDRESIIEALFERDPAILRRQPPPASSAIETAFTYAKTHLLPLLTRIWAVPDDLAHAAGRGDLARVQRWFDGSGQPALGDLEQQYPRTSPHLRQHDDLQWGRITPQHVLDTALAWAVTNGHFDVADFLLAHGANINTNWNSHEPASILHHLVFQPDPYDSMQFLIDRGIDLAIRDYRWGATAKGWAEHALRDERMVRFLEAAEARRGRS